MAALQGIQRRIRSVSGTRQISKALQLVSASKLRRAQISALAPQQYSRAARELLERLSSQPIAGLNPLYRQRPVKKALTILVAGDRGMAGAYNSNVLRALGRHIRDLKVPQSAICVGKRASMHVARATDIHEIASYAVDAGDANVTVALPVLEEAVELYLSGEVDVVHLLYTSFVSSVKQDVVLKQLLPVARTEESHGESELEPGDDELLEYATRRVLEATVLQAVLEARASEHAARMVAMMNATENAEDLIADLTLMFNNARQAGITQELAEISGGAEAITE